MWSWQSRNSDSRLTGFQPQGNQKQIRQRAPKPSAIDFLRWKPDEPNTNGHYKSWGNTKNSISTCPYGLQYRLRPHNYIHVVQFDKEFQTTLDQIGRLALACCKCSDSGEQCKVKKAMKSRGGLSHLSPSLAVTFLHSFKLLHTGPHYLNAWNRLA